MTQSENLSLNADPSFMSGEPLGKSLSCSEPRCLDGIVVPDRRVVVGPCVHESEVWAAHGALHGTVQLDGRDCPSRQTRRQLPAAVLEVIRWLS